MNQPALKSRFAPSPTGLLHLGNLRTALFNVLLARHHGGRFLLRIEDTDAERSRESFAESLKDDLRWLGLQWDEGPGADGGHGPYEQSRRSALYAVHFRALEQSGQAYPCFCSEQELAGERRRQRAAGQPPRYPGTCSKLTAAEIAENRDRGRLETLRFRVPRGLVVRFDDLVRGGQRAGTDDMGDFIIRRADGSAAFLFCNAVDDALMGVTHVLRGEDHLSNTARQCMILDALKLPRPAWGHLGLILGEDGALLSKRNGSRTVAELRDAGMLPAALLNYLARLGHSMDPAELLDLDGLAAAFRLERVGRSPARFDAAQLRHWQQLAVNALTPKARAAWILEAVAETVPDEDRDAFAAVVGDNVLFPDDARRWANACYAETLEHDAEALEALRTAGPGFFEAAAQAADREWPALIDAVRQASGARGRGLFLPLRLALTGERHGPEVPALHRLMGAERVSRRFGQARRIALAQEPSAGAPGRGSAPPAS